MYTIATAADLSDLLSSHRHVVLKFTASWCRPCQVFAPVFEEIQTRARDSCAFAIVDVDRVSEIAEQFAVSRIPHVTLFEDGVFLYTVSGAHLASLADIMYTHDMLAQSSLDGT